MRLQPLMTVAMLLSSLVSSAHSIGRSPKLGAGLRSEASGRLRNLPETGQAMLVALTGYGQSEHRQRALAAGFHDHLVKPVSPDALRELLEGEWSRLEGNGSVTKPAG